LPAGASPDRPTSQNLVVLPVPAEARTTRIDVTSEATEPARQPSAATTRRSIDMSQSTLSTASSVASFQVSGMTCGHCVRAVTTELTEIKSVTDVDVDLGSGVVTVVSDQPVDPARIVAAIGEAGYQAT
jgi:copper chaperone